jgi:hypothetical protein
VPTNPFVYGEVVPAAAFADRVVELDRLIGDLAAAQKVFLISPRRYGKSSSKLRGRCGAHSPTPRRMPRFRTR